MASHHINFAEEAAPISSEDRARVDMLRIQVNSLLPYEKEEVMKQQLKTLHESFLVACTTENVLSYAIKSLMDSCLESQSLCEKVAIVFHTISDIVIGESKVRSVILTCLQNNFSNLKHLQETNNKQWLNSIALFVAIFHHLRFANGLHFMMLATYVIEALQPLLSGDEAEMKLLAESVILNGQVLREGASDELDQLLVDVRTTLIQRNLSSECRLWLLLTADLAELNFGPLRAPILKFYKEHLGDGIQSILERGEKNKCVVIPDNVTEETIKLAVSPKSPSTPPPLPDNKSTFTAKSERRGHESNICAKSKDDLVEKVQHFRINNSEKSQNFAGAISAPSKGRSHWGHDDRFNNTEYEAPRPRPDRSRGLKVESPEKPEKAEKSERSERPERTKVPEGNWRRSPKKDSKDAPGPTSKISVPVCEEVWD